ncbi:MULTISPECIES: hypothetical protein [unclassified Bradyrhizobium]|uniref:hypothetical protein n=1 Tax=unclassified Bradyrhizobium TaxID=2631580 RepID=UPI003399C2F9
MAQDFTPIQSTDTLAASLPVLNENLVCLLSNMSGTSFPTTNLVVGMACYRSDQNKTYRLKSTGPSVWSLVENTGQSYLSQELADARYFQQGTPVKSYLMLQGVAAAGGDTVAVYFYDNPGAARWSLGKDQNQTFALSRYDSSGLFVDNPISIDNSTGVLKSQGGTVWHSLNDGSGSGLDADVLRGTTPGAGGLSVLAAADSAAVLAAIGATNSLPSTGQLGIFFAQYNETIAGYVPLNGGTIGDASSAANTRANPDCQNLFNWLWNRGAAVVGGRGASAAVDWAAHKRVTLPDTRGRHLVGMDYNSITGQAGIMTQGNYNTLGDMFGEQYHLLTQGEMPAHYHVAGIYDPTHSHAITVGYRGYSTSGGAQAWGFPPGVDGTTGVGTTGAATGVRINSSNGLDTTYSAGSGGAHNNLQPHLLVTFHIKL